MLDLIVKKKQMRREFLKKRSSIEQSVRSDADKIICSQLVNICVTELKPALVGVYISDGTEVDIAEFISVMMLNGVTVCAPRFNPNSKTGEYEMVEITDLSKDLVLGHYDIMEPVDSCPTLDLQEYDNLVWLVPGVVFDEQLGRLGRGKGVYDQMIESYKGVSIGVFYECQKTVAVPMAHHDCRLNLVVTEKGLYR